MPGRSTKGVLCKLIKPELTKYRQRDHPSMGGAVGNTFPQLIILPKSFLAGGSNRDLEISSKEVTSYIGNSLIKCVFPMFPNLVVLISEG